MTEFDSSTGRGVLFGALPDSGQVRAFLTQSGTLEMGWPCLVALPSDVMARLEATGDHHWYPHTTSLGLPSPAWVVNFCTDPDIYSKGLDWLDQTWVKQVPVFNAPNATRQTARDRKTEVFGEISGLIVPATTRVTYQTENDLITAFEQSGLRYPVLLRPTKWQNGLGLIRIDGPADWSNAIGSKHMTEEHFLIQFEDSQTPESEYLKARVLFVGGVPYIRHVKAASDWMVHNSAPTAIPGFAKSREIGVIDALVANDTFMRICNRIGECCRLDYFGADIGIDLANNRFVLFEANASMAAFFPLRDTLTPEQLSRRARLQDTPAHALADLIADPTKWRGQPQ